jgi:hypothetical protein
MCAKANATGTGIYNGVAADLLRSVYSHLAGYALEQRGVPIRKPSAPSSRSFD